MRRLGRRARRAWGLVALATAFAASGCVFRVGRAPEPAPSAVVIPDVPVLDFGDDDCGAGSLATLLAYWDVPVTVESLSAEIPKVRRGEVLSVDLLLAARRYGLDARWTAGDEAALAAEVRARRPVISLIQVADVPGVRRDYYHYVVVDGHDPERELIRVLFGNGPPRWIALKRFEKPWRGAGHALMQAHPADTLPESLMRLAVEREAAGRREEAIALYRRVLDSRPGSTLAWTNLGNAYAGSGRPDDAEAAYLAALAVDPETVDAANNLAWLLLEQDGDLSEAERLARTALAAESDPERRAAIRDTLEKIVAKRSER